MNPNDKSNKPVIRTGEVGNGHTDGQSDNVENIVSGPGFFERLFGTAPTKPPVKRDEKPADKPLVRTTETGTAKGSVPAVGGPTSVPVTGSNAADSSNVLADGAKEAAKVGDATSEAKPGDTTPGAGDAKPEPEKKSYVFREPEGPFKPHFARTRAELIFEPQAPTVYMTPDAYKRMCLYVELAPKEVGWLGTVSRKPNGDFLIEEVFLVEQEVTSVETELSVEGTEKLVLELLEDGDPGLDKSNKLHFWGHSHVRMGTSPSGTDESTMQRFAREGHEYYLRGIFNKLGRGCFDVYYYKEGFRLLDVPWAVIDPETGKVLLDRKKSFWSSDRPSGYSYGGGYGSTWRDKQEEAKQQDEQSGLSSFLKRDDNGPAPKKVDPLAIDDALRAEVTAEYKQKVKERAPAIFSWFRKKDDGQPGNGDNGAGSGSGADQAAQATSGPDDVGGQVQDGELIPTGSEIRPGGQPNKPFVRQPANVKDDAGKGDGKSGGGFFAWLGSLFESSPTPPTQYQSQERTRKRCTPQNCQDPSHPWSKNYKGPRSSNGYDNRADRLPDDAQ